MWKSHSNSAHGFLCISVYLFAFDNHSVRGATNLYCRDACFSAQVKGIRDSLNPPAEAKKEDAADAEATDAEAEATDAEATDAEATDAASPWLFIRPGTEGWGETKPWRAHSRLYQRRFLRAKSKY